MECEVNVEIHSGPKCSLDLVAPEIHSGPKCSLDLVAPEILHCLEGSTSSRSSSSRSCSLIDTTQISALHYIQQDQLMGSQLVGSDEWSQDSGGGDPLRAPSTDRTMLESNLDYWRREHSRARYTYEEDYEIPYSKVRYNDTGSLEEVNVDHLVEYYVDEEDDLVAISEDERDSLRQQYRELWELRATLEEDEELLVGDRGKQKLDSSQLKHKHSDVQPMMKSSPDLSPDVEVVTSHTTSFESNTEPLDDAGISWHLLQLPSYESRRQTYKNILGWRLRRMEARATRQASQEDTSFDSVDTEGSSTDASRMEQATTSFESTTDNTDSTGGTDNQAHRLQQIRADSGYRSIENPPASSAPKPASRRQLPLEDTDDTNDTNDTNDPDDPDGPQHLISPDSDRETVLRYTQLHSIDLGDSTEVEATPVRASQRRPSLGESDATDSPSTAPLSPPPPPTPPPPPLPPRRRTVDALPPDEGVHGLEQASFWEGRRRSCGRSASKKRREFGRTSADIDAPAMHRRCHSLRHSYVQAPTYARDYSVDEKSDALFREFSRCEPWPNDAATSTVPAARVKPVLAAARQPASGSGYARHSQQSYLYSHVPVHVHSTYQYPDQMHKMMTRNSIHEEVASYRYTDDADAQATVPMIRVADEDSSDQL